LVLSSFGFLVGSQFGADQRDRLGVKTARTMARRSMFGSFFVSGLYLIRI